MAAPACRMKEASSLRLRRREPVGSRIPTTERNVVFLVRTERIRQFQARGAQKIQAAEYDTAPGSRTLFQDPEE